MVVGELVTRPLNALGKAPKYVGVAFAPFSKGMTKYFCRVYRRVWSNFHVLD